MESRIRVSDLLERGSVTLESADDRVSAEDPLIRGGLFHQELREGLVLHSGNAIEEHAFTVSSGLRAGLSCVFFLDGAVGVKINGRRFHFRGRHCRVIGASAIMSAVPQSFEKARRGLQGVCHVVVEAAPEWLGTKGFEEIVGARGGARLLKNHLACHSWTPTRRQCELVREILFSSPYVPELRHLYLEARAVEIVAETVATMMRADRAGSAQSVSRHDRIRLKRAQDYIAAHLSESLTVDRIARNASVSASGLQRLFRESEGESVFAYVRRLRMERAFSSLQAGSASVQEASLIAGYSSPANFATAFKRLYGITPREVFK